MGADCPKIDILIGSDNYGKILTGQSEIFSETGDSINGLLTVRDQSGLRRVKTKIIERDESYAFLCPILLPSRHHNVNCLIGDYHLRCVHLELVTSISTECFIQAFRRFIARRGQPSIVYSDNGTNFVGASAGLKKVDWEKVVSQETLNPITWKFIPPTAAWWGGWWERLIRSIKNLIVRVLGQASVNYEELLTIL
ncbi:integrase catalytic domain-containing protein [Trichonephila clavipes]|nr:integrase catalytic domain-containing protein [Trichonephila clavipes]